MKVGIAGLGLIGGSLAKAYEKSGAAVYGYDGNRVVQDYAKLQGTLTGDLDRETIGDCDLLLVALYPQVSIDYLKEMAPYISKDTLVMDCCGVKREVCRVGFALAEKHGFTFVGGHPMAGKERSGFDASEASLFYNASYILVPGEAPQSATDTLVSLAKSMGFGTIKYCTQQKHDRMIAYTSQIPHVLACAYVMSPRCDEHSGFSAGSYRDVSRVARINAELWADLFLANREELADETEELVRNIERIRTAVAKNDRAELVALLSSAREKKEKFG